MSASKKIIVVWGAQQTGKTNVIKQVYELIINGLLKLDAAPEIIREYPKSGVRDMDTDICAIVSSNSTKIGIHSRGDHKSHVKFGLDKFGQCDLIICATRSNKGARSSRATIKFVEDFEKKNKDYCVVWEHPRWVTGDGNYKIDDAKKDEVKEKTASMIFAEVQEFIANRNRQSKRAR